MTPLPLVGGKPMAFLAPVSGFSASSSLFGQQALAPRARFPARARTRSVPVPARIFALGAAPAPQAPEPDAEGEAAAAADPAQPAAAAAEASAAAAAGGEEDAVAAPPPEEVTADDILNSPSFLKKKLEIVQKELIDARAAAAAAEDAVKDEKGSYVRLVADFENYRRRSAEDMRRLETKSTAKVCKAILDVLDNFDRADAAVKAETDREISIQKSYANINRQLVEALTKLKIEPIDAVGSPFDPEMHEAIQRIESPDFADGVVCAQYSKGYVIEDSLIRAAVVAVSSGPGPEVADAGAEGEKDAAATDVETVADAEAGAGKSGEEADAKAAEGGK